MEGRESRPNWLWMIISMIALMALGAAAYWFWNRPQLVSLQDWSGQWQIEYFYENQPALLYEGSLFISVDDTLQGRLEVFAPKSNKPEIIPLEQVEYGSEDGHLRAVVIHNLYKINGGYMREHFTLQLEHSDSLSGTGSCVEFCAEGTEQVPIHWSGIKNLEN